jgi:hypothetical protein
MTTHTIGNVGQISQARATGNKQEPKQERLEEKDTKLKIISCVIMPFVADPDENLHVFLRSNHIKYHVSDEMTLLWPYGRVIETSAGFNGEFHRTDDEFMSLMFLGKERDDVLKLMSRIVEQNIEIEFKNNKLQ